MTNASRLLNLRIAFALAMNGALLGWFGGYVFAQNSSLLRGGVMTDTGPVEVVPTPGGVPAAPAPITGAAPGAAPPPGAVSPSTANGNPRVLSPSVAGPGLQGVSWTYQPAPPLRSFQVQDIITIRVDEVARMMAEGESEKRRLSLFQAVLTDWIRISQGQLKPDPQADGDPTVNAQSQANSRNEASIEAREMLTFNIAARVVDIRPNGNLVLEARKTYRINDNLWETSLSGICRAQDIAPDNVVLSRDLIDLEIRKQDRGQLRDGYNRGWFQRFFDRVKPF